MKKMQNAFKAVLARKKLLDVHSGTKVVGSLDAARELFGKWTDETKAFTYKKGKAHVEMTTQEQKFGQIKCIAVISWGYAGIDYAADTAYHK